MSTKQRGAISLATFCISCALSLCLPRSGRAREGDRRWLDVDPTSAVNIPTDQALITLIRSNTPPPPSDRCHCTYVSNVSLGGNVPGFVINKIGGGSNAPALQPARSHQPHGVRRRDAAHANKGDRKHSPEPQYERLLRNSRCWRGGGTFYPHNPLLSLCQGAGSRAGQLRNDVDMTFSIVSGTHFFVTFFNCFLVRRGPFFNDTYHFRMLRRVYSENENGLFNPPYLPYPSPLP